MFVWSPWRKCERQKGNKTWSAIVIMNILSPCENLSNYCIHFWVSFAQWFEALFVEFKMAKGKCPNCHAYVMPLAWNYIHIFHLFYINCLFTALSEILEYSSKIPRLCPKSKKQNVHLVDSELRCHTLPNSTECKSQTNTMNG